MLPVGSHEEAARLLARLIADPPAERLPAPPAARFKSPLRYHHLSWGHNDTLRRDDQRTAHADHGVDAARASCRAPGACKGPAQRRLGLATVRPRHRGQNIRAAIRDRHTAEADQALNEIVRLSRVARARSVESYPLSMVVPAVGVLLAFFVLPPRWGIVVLVAVVIWEVAEKLFWLRLIRRYPVSVGRETLIGLPVTATTFCGPDGRVRPAGRELACALQRGSPAG